MTYEQLEEQFNWCKKRNDNQAQTIRSLRNKVDALTKSGEEMGNEITHLKLVIAGQKGRLTLFAKEVEKWKTLELEADELNEKRIAQVEEKEKIIIGLQEQANSLRQIINDRNESLRQVNDDLTFYKANYEYFKSLPWYKRIFAK